MSQRDGICKNVKVAKRFCHTTTCRRFFTVQKKYGENIGLKNFVQKQELQKESYTTIKEEMIIVEKRQNL